MKQPGLLLATLLLLVSGVRAGAVDTHDETLADETLRDEVLRDDMEQLGWELCEKLGVPGVAIAVVRAGQVAFVMGCGWADVEEERVVTEDTVFNIGSISKCVGAWGLMKLVEEQKLQLDAPVLTRRWQLPASSFDSKGVTLRRLLSHTAGLSLHGYPGFWPDDELPTIERSLGGDTNGAGAVQLEAEPGSRWKYSGGGYTLAQLLLEETSGRDFAAFMQAEVLLPLGMQHSAYGWTANVLQRSATPYDGEGKTLPRGGPCFPELAAAGLQTTAADMARFALASLPHYRGESEPHVLRLETIESMQEAVPPGEGYGLGYQIENREGIRAVGHGGANQGWMSYFRVVPDSGDGLVLLTNSSNGQALIRPLSRLWLDSLVAARESKAPTAGSQR